MSVTMTLTMIMTITLTIAIKMKIKMTLKMNMMNIFTLMLKSQGKSVLTRVVKRITGNFTLEKGN